MIRGENGWFRIRNRDCQAKRGDHNMRIEKNFSNWDHMHDFNTRNQSYGKKLKH